jgi:hypothetical protein
MKRISSGEISKEASDLNSCQIDESGNEINEQKDKF